MFLKIGEFRTIILTTFHIYRNNFSQKSSNFLFFRKKNVKEKLMYKLVQYALVDFYHLKILSNILHNKPNRLYCSTWYYGTLSLTCW